MPDRQARQEPVERRVLLARARRRGSGGRLLAHPLQAGEGRPRRAGRGRPGVLTSPLSTSWSISFVPRPSMSIASRWAYQRSHSLSWSGQRRGGFVQWKSTSPSVAVDRAAAARARRSGSRTPSRVPSRAAASTRTTWGMISPAFWITTVSPTRTSLRRISSALCRLARLTVVPARGHGRQVGHGRELARLADLDA